MADVSLGNYALHSHWTEVVHDNEQQKAELLRRCLLNLPRCLVHVYC